MKDCREKYVEYLSKKGLVPKTQKNYSSRLNLITRDFPEETRENDFYSINDNEYDSIINKIENSQKYSDLNKTLNNELSAALNHFKSFLKYCELSRSKYFSVTISKEEYKNVVDQIFACEKDIVISQITQLKDSINIGQLVFMVPYGDKAPWKKGLAGIGKISKTPYDDDGKNCKINVDMFCSFDSISREEFIPYRGTYDSADIAPSTKASQNQALKSLTLDQVASIIRGIIELRPNVKEQIINNVDQDIIDLAFGNQEILYKDSVKFRDNFDICGYNKIYYGAPGCGKSYYVNEMWGDNCETIRTIFYPDYTYSDFVGQILPGLDENEKPTYKFEIGPFTKALIKSFENPNKKVALIIEEINRGNAAAIFGDIFQLLDRNDSGESKYRINNDFISKELSKNISGADFEKIYLPNNLYLIATMNTSDQNVYPLDTAFQRRWNMEKVSNSFKDDKDNYVSEKAKKLSGMFIPKTDCTYEDFVKQINKKILGSNLGLNGEDKQIGVYFLSAKELSYTKKSNENWRPFAEKMLKYLWDDAAKIDRTSFFPDSIRCLDELIEFYQYNPDKIMANLGFEISADNNEQ